MKIRLDIEYDGMKFCGWQRQASDVAINKNIKPEESSQKPVPVAQPPSAGFSSVDPNWDQRLNNCSIPNFTRYTSVQGTIETTIINAFGGRLKEVTLHGAGRTDTGVHALNQVAHFEIDNDVLAHSSWTADNVFKLSRALNFYLIDRGVIIKSSSIVPPDFHARFSAKYREYLYIIHNRFPESVILKNRAWNIKRQLDVSIMQEAAQLFVGHHDFRAFRSADCQATNTVRTMDSVNISVKNDLIMITVLAKSFLHNQVRIMVGTLVQIGLHKMPKEIIKDLLENRDRTKGGPTAPPYGLYLKNVGYDNV